MTAPLTRLPEPDSRAAKLAFCDQWRRWLLLAGKPAGWRAFRRERCGDCRALSLPLPRDTVPLLVTVQSSRADFYHAAAVAPVHLVEHKGEERIQRLELSATGRFHASVLLALQWADDAYGPPPTGLSLCVDTHVLPAPWQGVEVFDDESAGLAVLIAAAWHLQGVRPSQPVAFTGRLEEKNSRVCHVGAIEDKARAAHRAGVAWTLAPSPGSPSARAARLIELGEAEWRAWLKHAEEILAGHSVVLEPDLEVWEAWLVHVERLSQARQLEAVKKAVEALSKRAKRLHSTDPRWDDIVFRLRWEEATLALHRGASRTAARGLRKLKMRVERMPAAQLYSQRAVRLSAGLLQAAIDNGARLPAPGVEGHLRGAVASRFSDNATRLYALGALAEWVVYTRGWQRRPQPRTLAAARRLLEHKRKLEEAAARTSGDRLLRSDGQRAALLSVAGEWPEVPDALARLLDVEVRDLPKVSAADRTNWRYQAFYAARWFAHCRLVSKPTPKKWETWWRVTRPALKKDVKDNDETHLLLGLERSLLMLDGSQSWTPSRQRRLEMVFEAVKRGARTYEQDFLVAWGFAAALAWLGRRWRKRWAASWAARRSACLDHLNWHGRHRELRRRDAWLERQAPASDRRGAALQAILGVVLY